MFKRWSREEVGLLVAGCAGLGIAAGLACSGSTSGTTATCNADSSTAVNTQQVTEAADLFLATLTDAQRKAIQYEPTLENARVWSNFPTPFVKRNGVKLGDLSSGAQSAARLLIDAAAGTAGAKLLAEIRAADQFLVTDGKASGDDYGEGLYFIAFHGTPTVSNPWMLQISGHHLAYNFTYGGRCTSATPLHDAAEPLEWTDAAGTHAPLEAQRAAMVALLASVSANADAKLSGTFSDLVNGPTGGGPGGGSGGDTRYPSNLSYPTSGRGAPVSAMSSEQKALVKTAIEAWVKNVADPVASALLAEYESDDALNATYVGYSGSPDLSTRSSYARIDGPRVWIELTVQGGIIYRNNLHHHTLWRDKASDYGAELVSQ
jgi:hypothetical protein